MKGTQKETLLASAREHVNLAMQGQTSRGGSPDMVLCLLYADICMAEGSGPTVEEAAVSYQQVSKLI